MKKIHLFILLIVPMFYTSCFKEDDKIEPHQVGDFFTNTIEMGEYYSTQAYFDLSSNQNVGSNNKDSWDLAFSAKDSTMVIRLNSAKFMRAANMYDTTFYSISDTTNLKWAYDASSGTTDSLAIAGWFEIVGNDTTLFQNTYIIDRGINSLGINQGISKIKVIAYRRGEYTIQFSKLNNSDFHQIKINTNNTKNYVQLSLQGAGTPMDLEPNKESWDLFFTQYTDILTTSDGEKYPYLVTGVLSNCNGVEVAMSTNLDFNTVTRSEASTLQFNNELDAIGYLWKYYDFDDAVYTVHTNQTYIIKDTDGFFYKLRFIGFYNNLGQKGYPQFEFQKL